MPHLPRTLRIGQLFWFLDPPLGTRHHLFRWDTARQQLISLL